uniref:Uncharacterized protein n=1 Tax=Cyanothece sp. (strain PCC 7425 / ATCC 29141) TaxID=395961 RepID=B8HZ89_CYAP4
MSGKTISAYTDTATAERVAALAKLEGRSTAQIGGLALKFFTRLPVEARTALHQIELLGEPGDLEAVLRDITRTLLHRQYEIAQRQVVEQMQIEHLEPLETEDDFLAAAIRLTQ